MVGGIGGRNVNKSLEYRIQKAEGEFHQLGEWRIAEVEKVICALESQGKFLGLDGDVKEINLIRKEYYKRVLEIFDKYDLPNRPNFDKWLG